MAQRPPEHVVQRLAIPAYFASDPEWERMADAAPAVGVAVFNPSSGAGSAPVAGYAARVARARAAGITVLGYVDTDRGNRPISAVRREIESYFAWYAIDGIFLDQASTDCARVRYYADARAAIRAKSPSGTVVLNPGTQTSECYMDVADIVVTFEDTYAVYATEFRATNWTRKYAPERFWHLVHDVRTTEDLAKALALSAQRRAGWLYIATATMPNPWDRLPAPDFWGPQIAATGAQERGERTPTP